MHHPSGAYIKLFLIALFAQLIIFLDGGCKKTEIDSAWADHRIAVDGVRGNDWDGVMYKINDQPLAVGFRNDGDYLYLLITTFDRSLQRRFFSGGLTVWFDSSGSDDEILGIHFPLIQGLREMPERSGMQDGDTEEEGFRFEKMQFNSTDMEISRPAEDMKERVNVNQLKDIEARIALAGGNLTYELKIPLRGTGPDRYFIGTEAGATIGIGIETSEPSREHTTQFERRRRDAEELPPGLRESEAPAENGSRESRSGYSQPVSFWARVKLAGKNP